MNSRETTPINLTLPNNQWKWIHQMSTKFPGSDAITVSACVNSVMIGDVAMPSTIHPTEPTTTSTKVLDLPLSQTAYLSSTTLSVSAMACQIVQACMNASDEWLVFGAMKNQLSLEKNKHPQDEPGDVIKMVQSNKGKVPTRDLREQEVVVVGTDNIAKKSPSANGKKKVKSYTKVPLNLTKQQWEWLETMATKHKLSSMDKAVRCCVNCVALEGEEENDLSTNSQEVDSSSSHNEEEQGIIKQVGLSNEQLSWLDTKLKQNGQGVAQRLIQTCMEMEEYAVFGIIRCKSSVAKCEGASAAVEVISKQYGQKQEEVLVKEHIDISSNKKCGCDHDVVSQGCGKTGDDSSSSSQGGKKTPYRQIPVVLKQNQWDWLDEMAVKHKLSSMDKAVRCCINCVALEGAQTERKEVESQPSINKDDKVEKQVELSGEQIAWVESNLEKIVQEDERIAFMSQNIGTCMAMEEYNVFGIIRCKKSFSQCTGAQEAVKNIGDHFHQTPDEVAVKENIDISSGPGAPCGCTGKKK